MRIWPDTAAIACSWERNDGARVLPLGLRKPLFGLLGAAYPKADWAPQMFRAKTTFQALARDSVAGYLDAVSLVREPQRRKLFSAGFRSELQGYEAVEVLRRHADAPRCEDSLSLVQYLDLKTYLAGDILTKVDRASMAHSLEVRVPLLDHKLVEWMSGLPPTWKLNRGTGKYIFKKAMDSLSAGWHSRPAQDGVRGAARRLVPRTAAPGAEGCCARSAAHGLGSFQRRCASRARRAASTGSPRSQRCACGRS